MEENAPSGRRSGWKQDPAAVQADILRAATEEFARNGLDGARISDIAERTRTTKRMIFYYFQDKQTLYRRVLEEAYRKIRAEEAELNLGALPPLQALRRLVEFTFDHHRRSEPFIRLVMIENIHAARHLRDSDLIARVNDSAIERIRDICTRGQATGEIRPDITPLELHWMISALCFFNVSNRPTFGTNFGDELFTEQAQARLRERVADMVVAAARA
ncbi:TetR family transcriptional regulator [Albidovulum inexpectatum]|uniref:TetR family transcriptional regulator n=1 Tax=Albidovulum inexpectatum TaxID=196587 RepID=A0A2S5JHC0_9RHOB|nr:TetR family transcriptional regulator [Albidovulum inexpectatum]